MNKPMLVKFHAEGHRYFDEKDNELPSVSIILESAGVSDFSMIRKDVLVRAQRFGTAFHRAAHLLEMGELGFYDERMEPWITQLKKFLIAASPEWSAMETCLGSKMGFAGTPDRIGKVFTSQSAILDFKSGAYTPAHGLQTAAYKILAEENGGQKIKNRFTVYFDAKRYSVMENKDKNDESVFMSMLRTYQWKKQRGII